MGCTKNGLQTHGQFFASLRPTLLRGRQSFVSAWVYRSKRKRREIDRQRQRDRERVDAPFKTQRLLDTTTWTYSYLEGEGILSTNQGKSLLLFLKIASILHYLHNSITNSLFLLNGFKYRATSCCFQLCLFEASLP